MGGSASSWKPGIFKVAEEDDGFLEGLGFSKLPGCKNTLNNNSRAEEIAQTVKCSGRNNFRVQNIHFKSQVQG